MHRGPRFLSLLLCSLLLLSSVALASPTLQNGSTGQDVLVLQETLKAMGYKIKSLDGIYGTETETAVKKFQKDKKMRVTGVVNNSTWRELKKSKPKNLKLNLKYKEEKPSASAGSVKSAALAPNGTLILPKAKVDPLIKTAKSYIGTPYQFGGTGPKSFDCSGYLQYIFRAQGISIPRTADEQYKLGLRTASSRELVPGDLVFFETYTAGASHCGLYLGSGKFIHTSSSKGVRIDSIFDSYWSPKYLGGKHIVK